MWSEYTGQKSHSWAGHKSNGVRLSVMFGPDIALTLVAKLALIPRSSIKENKQKNSFPNFAYISLDLGI